MDRRNSTTRCATMYWGRPSIEADEAARPGTNPAHPLGHPLRRRPRRPRGGWRFGWAGSRWSRSGVGSWPGGPSRWSWPGGVPCIGMGIDPARHNPDTARKSPMAGLGKVRQGHGGRGKNHRNKARNRQECHPTPGRLSVLAAGHSRRRIVVTPSGERIRLVAATTTMHAPVTARLCHLVGSVAGQEQGQR